MGIALVTPSADELDEVVRALREWQREDASMQLHPGDLGWAWQYGPEATAAGVRTWRVDGTVAAVALVDKTVLRLTVSPEVWDDGALAERIVADAFDPDGGVLPAGEVAVETPDGTAVQHAFTTNGWTLGEAWAPLRRDLSQPVETPALRIEEVGPDLAADYVAVHNSSFGTTRFTVDHWQAMTAGTPFTDARCLLGFDDDGTPVAEVTVWSAGPGRPGLLEPLGTHADHRYRGHGRAISLAAARALQELGSSSALVCTPSANVGGVAAYVSAGYQRWPERLDRTQQR